MGYYVRVEPSVNLYVQDTGPRDGKPILFLHGWPANHKLFEYQFDVLPGLGYRCIGWDMRGFGKSDKPWHGYHYDRLADDVRGVVESLGLEDFLLVGHSVGGAIATRYMGRHHGHGVARLALLGAAVPSLTQRPGFPYGLPKEAVNEVIRTTYQDRPNMLHGFTKQFFHQPISEPFAAWFLQLGLMRQATRRRKWQTRFATRTCLPTLEK